MMSLVQTEQQVLTPALAKGPHAKRLGAEGAGRMRALDGLRGAAILMVMVHHFARCMTDEVPVWHFFHVVLNVGAVGVDLFFVLSGFLITGILLDAKGEKAEGNRPQTTGDEDRRAGAKNYFFNFYMRRTLRIFPLYFGVLAVVAAVALLHDWSAYGFDRAHFISLQPWLWTLTSNILIARAHDWVVVSQPFDMNHFWSLAVEEQFYLFWPAMIWLLPRRRLLYVLVGLIGFSCAARVYLELGGHGKLTGLVFTPFHFDPLALGGIAALGVRWVGAKQLASFARKVVVASAAVLLAATIYQGGWDYLGKFVDTGGFFLQALLFAGLLIMALCEGSWTQRLFSSRVLCIAGTYSYGLYIFHQLVLQLFFHYFDPEGVARWSGSYLISYIWFFAAAGFASLALAWASYHFYELPFLRLKRFFR